LAAGCAYLPLAVDYPDERLRCMLTDSATPFVVTRKVLQDRLARLVPPGVGIRGRVMAAADGRVGLAPGNPLLAD
jgi:non-ribosomal peptide synthetase component F